MVDDAPSGWLTAGADLTLPLWECFAISKQLLGNQMGRGKLKATGLLDMIDSSVGVVSGCFFFHGRGQEGQTDRQTQL